MLALAADWPERVLIAPRTWEPADLAGAAIAVAAIDDEAEAARLRGSAARAAGVPVNVVDKPPSATSSSAPSSTARRS